MNNMSKIRIINIKDNYCKVVNKAVNYFNKICKDG